MRVLFIDNFDSFTYNLVEEFEKRDNQVLVYRNNISMEKLDKIITDFEPQLITLSPGPSTPEEAGICVELVQEYYQKIPIWGICLGYQCIVEAFDGKIAECEEKFHGKASIIQHNEKNFLEGIENPIQVGRYHSLSAAHIPEEFVVASEIRDIPMAVYHKNYPIYGVQFHPESILTPVGGQIVENIIRRNR